MKKVQSFLSQGFVVGLFVTMLLLALAPAPALASVPSSVENVPPVLLGLGMILSVGVVGLIIFGSKDMTSLSYQVDLPENRLIKGLYLRFTGNNAAGQQLTLADLGQIQVNFRGTDIDNLQASQLSAFNNMKFGVAEFSSALAGAFVAAIYVPFHAWWDMNSGLLNLREFNSFLRLNFPAVATVIADGNVECSYIPATSEAGYFNVLTQQDVTVQNGLISDSIKGMNISGVYFTENANVSRLQILKDGAEYINATQATAKALSNMNNRVETAITLIEADLNPNRALSAALSDDVTYKIQGTLASSYQMFYNAIMFPSNRGTVTSEPPARVPPAAVDAMAQPFVRVK